jgi:hypothetical protein
MRDYNGRFFRYYSIKANSNYLVKIAGKRMYGDAMYGEIIVLEKADLIKPDFSCEHC